MFKNRKHTEYTEKKFKCSLTKLKKIFKTKKVNLFVHLHYLLFAFHSRHLTRENDTKMKTKITIVESKMCDFLAAIFGDVDDGDTDDYESLHHGLMKIVV